MSKKFSSAEEFAKYVVPNSKQSTARKYMIDFYNKVNFKEDQNAEGVGTQVTTGSQQEGTQGQKETSVYLRNNAETRVETKQGEVNNFSEPIGNMAPVGEGKVKASRLAERVADTLNSIPESEKINIPNYNQMNNRHFENLKYVQ
jgi:nitrous oxide reductase accessory protein NosL